MVEIYTNLVEIIKRFVVRFDTLPIRRRGVPWGASPETQRLEHTREGKRKSHLSFFPDVGNADLFVAVFVIPVAIQWWNVWYPGSEQGGGYIVQRMLSAKSEGHCFRLRPNHPNGSIYGYAAWCENYCALLDAHPIYVDALDAFAAKGFLFLERLRPPTCKWNPDYAYPDLQAIFDRYQVISGIDNCHHFTPDLQIGLAKGWPRYSSDKALMEGFMRCGYPKALARRRVAAGCHWMCIPGMEYTMNDTVKVSLAKVFEVAWQELVASDGAKSAETLWDLFAKHLKIAVDATGRGIIHHLNYQTKSQPELILNLMQHGLVQKGVNITDGGANYYNMCVDGAGLAVVADSFAAVEHRIDRERRLTYDDLARTLAADYAGVEGERLRQLMLHSARYGGGDTRGDWWAVRASRLWTALVRDLVRQHADDPRHVNFIPGLFSWSNTILLGARLGATPNGRKAGEPINHGANPNGGFRPDGAVTAMCNSIAAVQPGYGNTAPVQLELDPMVAQDDEGLDKMCATVRAILRSGNTLLNINIVDAKKILATDRDPSKFPDLVVRVTGFTAFFAMLSPKFRALVVDRVRSVNPEATAS